MTSRGAKKKSRCDTVQLHCNLHVGDSQVAVGRARVDAPDASWAVDRRGGRRSVKVVVVVHVVAAVVVVRRTVLALLVLGDSRECVVLARVDVRDVVLRVSVRVVVIDAAARKVGGAVTAHFHVLVVLPRWRIRRSRVVVVGLVGHAGHVDEVGRVRVVAARGLVVVASRRLGRRVVKVVARVGGVVVAVLGHCGRVVVVVLEAGLLRGGRSYRSRSDVPVETLAAAAAEHEERERADTRCDHETNDDKHTRDGTRVLEKVAAASSG